jgi:hypothetical protein
VGRLKEHVPVMEAELKKLKDDLELARMEIPQAVLERLQGHREIPMSNIVNADFQETPWKISQTLMNRHVCYLPPPWSNKSIGSISRRYYLDFETFTSAAEQGSRGDYLFFFERSTDTR